MIRVLPFLVELVLVVYCLIDAVQADEARVRNLPKWAWILLMILIPILGCVAWLIAGRPAGPRIRTTPAPPPATGYPQYRQPVAPDDDPEFLARLRQQNQDSDLLKRWEDDLKRREEELRKTEDDPSD